MARFGHMQSIFKDRINGKKCHSGDGGGGRCIKNESQNDYAEIVLFYIYK